ncbi:MAG: glutamate-5-semialdehyde dehydrogenase [Firmicutes bacterium]|nr:glutamate-5-semialdehyde dehydrogenase [Bacillota bacterium]
MKFGSTARNNALLYGSKALLDDQALILEANALDLEAAKVAGQPSTVIDRLRLDEERIAKMAVAMRDIAGLTDPLGEIVGGWTRPNGLKVKKVRVPLGVIGIVYENRPNVTSDAAALCLKSGNAVMLRGSAGAINSNIAIEKSLKSGLEKAGLPLGSITLIKDTTREGVVDFVQLDKIIDCIIPRGGPGLVSMIKEHASVPYVIDGDGNCHVYVDRSCDLEMAINIVVNAKTSRPSVCNAMETLLLHQDIAKEFLSLADSRLAGVELRGDKKSQAVLSRIKAADESDYEKEFLDLIMAVKVVDDIDEAIDHINKYSTGHSEAIVTSDYRLAKRFIDEVDAAAVLVNASTRFIDGGELGLGAEIGISTQKLHARGPMGVAELTSVKFVVEGDGQIRL